VSLISPSRPADDDPLALLTACHARIRSFAGLARRLGEAAGLAAPDVVDAAERVGRYFGEALPLHAQDEEESLAPRLRGRHPALDRALERMSAEHLDHAPLLARLIAVCERLAVEPGAHEAVRAELLSVSTALVEAMESHLAQEERDIFPALATLDPETQASVAREIRARRRAAASP
jgi:iron-sulfur cluster repair protein YtfE (RIC family)